MRHLTLVTSLLAAATGHAGTVFTAAKNISERLEKQEGRVGACSQVLIFVNTLREIDGDHDFLGFEGVAADGRRFVHLKEFGADGSRPRVKRLRTGEYLVYVASARVIGFGEHREPILTLRTDGEGRTIVDLVTPDGRSLCASAAPRAVKPLPKR